VSREPNNVSSEFDSGPFGGRRDISSKRAERIPGGRLLNFGRAPAGSRLNRYLRKYRGPVSRPTSSIPWLKENDNPEGLFPGCIAGWRKMLSELKNDSIEHADGLLHGELEYTIKVEKR
jgi:hypothetical protein